MRWIRTNLAIAVAVLAATAAAAQTGGISVIVTDDKGQPLPGATVTISQETGFVATSAQLTDKNGIVEFPVLRPGEGYAIEVAFPGFNTIRQGSLRVRINDNQKLPVQMIEEFSEKVTVTARSEVIALDQNQQETKFSSNFISDLPVPGRLYTNVLTLAPGVQDADGDGNPNVHGSRSRDFQAVVSGVNNVDPLTGQQMSRVNPNSIEEMEIISAGAGVEFGRAQGGFARIIQKQGSNTHEGVAEFYYRTSKLDGAGAGNNSAINNFDYDWLQPSLQMSGPILKDKLWYRASLENRDIETPINVLSGVEISKLEDQTHDFLVTWQVAPRNKLALQFRLDPREISNVNVSSLVGSSASYAYKQGSQTTSLIWTAPYSPKVLVESTLAWQDQKIEFFPNTTDVNNACVSGTAFLEQAQCFNGTTSQISGSFPTEQTDHRQRLSAKGSATVYGGRFWGMSHQFKLGVSAENERYFRDLRFSPSLFYFVVNTPDEDTTGSGEQVNPFGIAIAGVPVPEFDSVRTTGTNWGVYGEDQFKPRQNLTMTLGVRLDREEIGAEGHGIFDPQAEIDAYYAKLAPFANPNADTYNPAVLPEIRLNAAYNSFTAYESFESFEEQLKNLICDSGDSQCQTDITTGIDQLASVQKNVVNTRTLKDININNSNISPYFSIAWDPFSDGKMAIKASAGRHYNNIPLEVPLQEIEPGVASLAYRVELGGENAGEVRLLDGISPSFSVSMVDPNLRTPYQDEFTVSFERELWAETSVSLTYINRKFRDQLQDKNVNVNSGDYGTCNLQNAPTDATLLESWGAGQEVTDPHTRETYIDSDPGPGDGRLDDCVGDTISYRSGETGEGDEGDTEFGAVQRPDQLLDLYNLNPFWGDIYLIGNFNSIDYEGVVLDLVRRQYRSWELSSSYTYSTAKGNGEDYNQGFDDDPTVTAVDVAGYQAYDQRHVVKINATTITPWGIRMGTSVSWQSGLPYSLLYRLPSFDTLAPQTAAFGVVGSRSRFSYPTGARNDQRNQSYWNVDLKMTKEINLARSMTLQVSAEVFNALDDGTYKVYNRIRETGIQVNGTNEAYREFGRQWQLGVKLAF